jgi:hypothetical protein
VLTILIMTLHDRIIDTLHELSEASVYTMARIMHSHDFNLLEWLCIQMSEEGILSSIAPTDVIRDVRYGLTPYGKTLFVPPVEKKRGMSSRTIKTDIREKQRQLLNMEDSVKAVLRCCPGGMATLAEIEQKLVAVDPCLLSSTIYKLLYRDELYKIGPVVGMVS